MASLCRLAAACLANLRGIFLIDNQRRQGRTVQIDNPTILAARDDNIGGVNAQRFSLIGLARLRVHLTDNLQESCDFLDASTSSAGELNHVTIRKHFQIVQNDSHEVIELSALVRLNAKALR